MGPQKTRKYIRREAAKKARVEKNKAELKAFWAAREVNSH